jgi:phytol kinase
MFVGGLGLSVGFISLFGALGYVPALDWSLLRRLALVSLTATVVEALPANQLVDDNLSVPLAALLLGSAVF